jgi:hypothetical protein
MFSVVKFAKKANKKRPEVPPPIMGAALRPVVYGYELTALGD